MHFCRKKHGVVHFCIQAKVHILRYALLPYQVLMKSSNILCVGLTIRNIIIMHFQQWFRDTHFCQTKLRHPKRYALFEHDLLHNDWCSLYALLPARKNIKFCKFWYQIRTFDKTCSYAPLLVKPRYLESRLTLTNGVLLFNDHDCLLRFGTRWKSGTVVDIIFARPMWSNFPPFPATCRLCLGLLLIAGSLPQRTNKLDLA